MEAIVEIVGLAVKIYIALIVEILEGVPIKAKIGVSKTVMSKKDVLIIVEEGRVSEIQSIQNCHVQNRCPIIYSNSKS